jgi:hypothetical protein
MGSPRMQSGAIGKPDMEKRDVELQSSRTIGKIEKATE